MTGIARGGEATRRDLELNLKYSINKETINNRDSSELPSRVFCLAPRSRGALTIQRATRDMSVIKISDEAHFHPPLHFSPLRFLNT